MKMTKTQHDLLAAKLAQHQENQSNLMKKIENLQKTVDDLEKLIQKEKEKLESAEIIS